MTKGSDLLVAALENEGVDRIFGVPGEENLAVVESLRTSSIELVLTRHEQAAAFMAATYGRLTGKPGVCISTLGPGALNLATGAAYAHLGAMPMIMITGQKGILSSRQARFQMVDVVATMNLNGDYLSDALAAQVGGIGIAPGANINYVTGHAVFEATHGTAPKYADLDQVNPGSVILSGEMMLRYMGWTEAADAIITAMDRTIGQKTVTYDFARLMDGATKVKCSEFGDALIRNL